MTLFTFSIAWMPLVAGEKEKCTCSSSNCYSLMQSPEGSLKGEKKFHLLVSTSHCFFLLFYTTPERKANVFQSSPSFPHPGISLVLYDEDFCKFTSRHTSRMPTKNRYLVIEQVELSLIKIVSLCSVSDE